MPGLIFNVQRFSLHDGPGLRSTVFMKGCPLHCAWCHNPESQSTHLEFIRLTGRCMRCERCSEEELASPTVIGPVSYTHLRAHETVLDLVCRLLLEKKHTHHESRDLRVHQQ